MVRLVTSQSYIYRCICRCVYIYIYIYIHVYKPTFVFLNLSGGPGTKFSSPRDEPERSTSSLRREPKRDRDPSRQGATFSGFFF